MNQSSAAGTFRAQKKDGSIYYRASVTYKNKHISLGSYENQALAHQAYKNALQIVGSSSIQLTDYSSGEILSHDKWVSLINFRDNNIYIKNPIYLRPKYFEYYYSPKEVYLFDIDDLFFYSGHKIMKRHGHLFVSEYGMQTTILSRYGIKSHAVSGRDYNFINGNPNDLRYENIEIINPYYGVQKKFKNGCPFYHVSIHIRGNFTVGTYSSAEIAAIAYNKAVDTVKSHGCTKNFPLNYIESLSGRNYAEIYSQITIPDKLTHLHFD